VSLKVPEIRTNGFELDVGAVERGREFGPRQVEILDLVGRGYSDKEIARTLGISRHTVRTHLERLFSAHGWNNRAQAATAWARTSITFSPER
jgi:DNA-binding NarL/FixJ family response regulator